MSGVENLPNCRIGDGSLYDADMDLIENFVQVHLGIASPEIKRSVQLYYESKILSYWDRFKKAINQSEVPLDILGNQYKIVGTKTTQSKFDQVKNNLKKYEEMYKTLLNDFLMLPSLSNTQRIFSFIAACYCLNHIDDIDINIWPTRAKLQVENVSLYPLPNELGFFSLNSYVFAAIHDVFLIGVPDRPQSFDNNVGMTGEVCPKFFAGHDIRHTEQIYITPFARNLYVRMMTDNNTGRLEKEIHCFVFWLLVHENDVIKRPTVYEFYKDYLSLRSLSNFIFPAILRDFAEEFVRFKDLIIDDDGIKFIGQKIWEDTISDINEFGLDWNIKMDVLYELTIYFSWRRVKELYPEEVENL